MLYLLIWKAYSFYHSVRNNVAFIKYWHQYKLINVNLFFDAFDEENPNLAMVLVYDKNCYYTSLNIKNITISKEYLVEISTSTLEQILDDNCTLNASFNNIEKHTALKRAKWINYSDDKIFSNTNSRTLTTKPIN